MYGSTRTARLHRKSVTQAHFSKNTVVYERAVNKKCSTLSPQINFNMCVNLMGLNLFIFAPRSTKNKSVLEAINQNTKREQTTKKDTLFL